MLIYDKFTIGTTNNQVAFNDYSNALAFATYRVEQRFPTKRSITEYDVKLPEVNGIADFKTLLGKEYYIIGGEMYPNTKDESGFHLGRRALRKLADLTTEQADPLSDFGYVPMQWTEQLPTGPQQVQLFVKVIYVDMKESTAQGVVQPFVIYAKIKDPTIYAVQAVTAATGTAVTTGATAGYPLQFPAQFGAVAAGLNGVITNPGDLPVCPKMTITGPVVNPRVTNLVTGDYMEVDVTLNTGDVLVVSYSAEAATITVNGINAYQNKTSGSKFFKLGTGTTNFSLTGSSLTTATSATLSFNPAYPLS